MIQLIRRLAVQEEPIRARSAFWHSRWLSVLARSMEAGPRRWEVAISASAHSLPSSLLAIPAIRPGYKQLASTQSPSLRANPAAYIRPAQSHRPTTSRNRKYDVGCTPVSAKT